MSEIQVFNAITRGNQMEWLTLTGLNPNVINARNPLSPEDEEILAMHISGLGDSAAWARGDLALYVREKVKRDVDGRGAGREEFNRVWGNEIARLSKLLGVSTKTLYNNITTASQWPIEARRNTGSVRYKHHEVLPGSMPLADRVRLIEQADAEGWNYARFYAVVHGHVLEDTGEPTETYQTPAQPQGDPVEQGTTGPNEFMDEDADFFGGEAQNAPENTYESTYSNGTSGASGGASYDASWGGNMNAVSLHIVSNSGVDLVVDQAQEPMKFCFVFTNGSTWEVSPDLTNGSLNIRRLDTVGA